MCKETENVSLDYDSTYRMIYVVISEPLDYNPFEWPKKKRSISFIQPQILQLSWIHMCCVFYQLHSSVSEALGKGLTYEVPKLVFRDEIKLKHFDKALHFINLYAIPLILSDQNEKN